MNEILVIMATKLSEGQKFYKKKTLKIGHTKT